MTRSEISEVVWRPAPGAFARSPVGRFATRHRIDTLAELARRSTEDPAWFWAAVEADLGLVWRAPYEQALDLADGPPWPHFYAGGQLNITETALDRWVSAGRGDHVALRWVRDEAETVDVTYAELLAEVERVGAGLSRLGVTSGDTVGMLLPMCPEAVVTLLAAARIGAVAVPIFSGYGAVAVRDRLNAASAKVLVTCGSVSRRGREIMLADVAGAAVAEAPTVETVVIVRPSARRGARGSSENWVQWEALAADGTGDCPAAVVDAEHPLLVLYTSGSTGRPKGCLHTHSGLPVKVAQEARHGMGVDEDSTALWLTDMGWVMGPWLTYACLINGATAVLFEGVPDWPSPDRLWRVAADTETTVLGLAPTVVRSLMAHGDRWAADVELPALAAIGSTGESWNHDPWMWCFTHVGGGSVPIVNISGGTECGGSILSGSIVAPLKPMSFAGPALGMAADVVDDHGRSIVGQVGELIVRQPWPGMTKGFVDDTDRYLETYWSTWPGVWRHGDFATVEADGAWFVLGRSDDTINIAGKRIGPAELESALVSDPAVVEAAVVGIPDGVKGEAIACFVVLAPDADPDLATQRLGRLLVAEFGKPFKPGSIDLVAALPKTRNGKVMRRVARAAYIGADVGDLTAIEDERVIEQYRRLGSSRAEPIHQGET